MSKLNERIYKWHGFLFHILNKISAKYVGTKDLSEKPNMLRNVTSLTKHIKLRGEHLKIHLKKCKTHLYIIYNIQLKPPLISGVSGALKKYGCLLLTLDYHFTAFKKLSPFPSSESKHMKNKFLPLHFKRSD